MAQVLAFPGRGEVFLDARGDGRLLRATWHHEAGVLVLSLWRDNQCAASFRLPAHEVADLVGVLCEGLARGYSAAEGSPAAAAGSAGTRAR